MSEFSALRKSLRLTPGSFLWLVSYDLTMSLRRVRGMFGAIRTRTVTLIVLGALISFHLVAWPLARWFGEAGPQGEEPRLLYPGLASMILFVMPWLVSQALTSMT
ncbi:MAG: hypothetical protein AB7J19_18235, partial [Beijerinckiaceae bacterium]